MLLKKFLPFVLLTTCIFYTVLFITACREESSRPDVSGIQLNVTALRFEKDIFSIDVNDPVSAIEPIRKKYGDFFDLYVYQITSIGSPDPALTAQHLAGFVSDSNFRSIYRDCEKKYADIGDVEADLASAFRYYKYYFPLKTIPKIVTMISGFSYPVVCDSTTLGIGLDMYMGRDYRFYSTIEPPLPIYLRNRMQKEYIVCDAMKGWAESDYGIDESSARMIDFMISQGRLIYFLDQITPDAADTLKTGYTAGQLKWCRENERQIWSFFIENKLLFSFDPNLMNKYVNDGPTTNGFPADSPGNIGKFIGWKIVKSYMSVHKEVSLESLMNEKSMQKIFDESKYKPEKN